MSQSVATCRKLVVLRMNSGFENVQAIQFLHKMEFLMYIHFLADYFVRIFISRHLIVDFNYLRDSLY